MLAQRVTLLPAARNGLYEVANNMLCLMADESDSSTAIGRHLY